MSNIILNRWEPDPNRVVRYNPRPKWVPESIYNEAVAAKKHYNEGWEGWVLDVSRRFNVTFEQAEIACLKGIKREAEYMKVVYGPKFGQWFIDYLEMDGIFDKVAKLVVHSEGEQQNG